MAKGEKVIINIYKRENNIFFVHFQIGWFRSELAHIDFIIL